MALAEAAQQVAAEFEYSDADVNNGVKEFIRQMRMVHTSFHSLYLTRLQTKACKSLALKSARSRPM